MDHDNQYLTLLEEKGIDVEETIRRFVGNETLFTSFLKKFFEQTDLSELKKVINEQNFQEAISIAHTLKGVTANLGIKGLYHNFSKMVEDMRADKYDELADLLHKTEVEFEELKKIVI